MPRQCLIGFDIGTSGCKATLMTADGSRVAEASMRYPERRMPDGASERPALDFWDAVCGLSRRLRDDHEAAVRDVVACGVAGQMRGVVCLDGDGDPVRPVILWNDNRCRRQLERIGDADAAAIRAATRNPLNTMCTLPKLMWVRDEEPELLRRTATVLFPKDYVNLRLTGAVSTDVSDASGSSLYLPDAGRWSADLASRAGITVERLPVVRASCDRIGSVTDRASAETGIPAGVPVAAGMSDATAEMLALGIAASGVAKIRLGTSGAISVIADSLPPSAAAVYCWSFLDGRRWMLDTNTRSCAASVDWARRAFYSEIASDDEAYGRMAIDAAGVVPGAEGVIFRPHLGGEDAPYWDPGLAGSFAGIAPSHDRAALTRAVYEGTAFALREALDASAAALGHPREFRFTGGGARNPVWLSIVAAVLGVGGMTGQAGGASLGAALCAGVAGRVFADAAEAGRIAARLGGTKIAPDPALQRAYEGVYARYRETPPSRRYAGVASGSSPETERCHGT